MGSPGRGVLCPAAAGAGAAGELVLKCVDLLLARAAISPLGYRRRRTMFLLC